MPKHYITQVHDLARLIPKGRVSTYGALADYLSLGSARMVGFALKQIDFLDESIPAHRVVNSKGELSGRLAFPTPDTMQFRLSREGTIVEKDRVVRFKDLFWHPKELDE